MHAHINTHTHLYVLGTQEYSLMTKAYLFWDDLTVQLVMQFSSPIIMLTEQLSVLTPVDPVLWLAVLFRIPNGLCRMDSLAVRLQSGTSHIFSQRPFAQGCNCLPPSFLSFSVILCFLTASLSLSLSFSCVPLMWNPSLSSLAG